MALVFGFILVFDKREYKKSNVLHLHEARVHVEVQPLGKKNKTRIADGLEPFPSMYAWMMRITARSTVLIVYSGESGVAVVAGDGIVQFGDSV